MIAQILIGFFPGPIYSQDNISWKVQHITTENGLSNRFVNCITQDKRGFTWIGTNFGLNRFDGHRIDILTRERHHLSTNIISDLMVDVHQQIWVIQRPTNSSDISYIDILDPISFKVQTLADYIGETVPFKLEDIKKIDRDSLDRLYLLVAGQTVFRFGEEGFQKLFQIADDQSVVNMNISGRRIYLQDSTLDTMLAYSLEGKLITGYPCPVIPLLINQSRGKLHLQPSDFGIYSQVKYRDIFLPREWQAIGPAGKEKDLFVCFDSHNMSNHYALLGPEGFSPLITIPSDDQLQTLTGYDPARKNIWGECTNGIFVFNLDDQTKEYPEPGKLHFYLDFYNDPKGNIWTATNDGVILYSQSTRYFSRYLDGHDPPYSCRGFAEDLQGNIYALSIGGHFILHSERKTLEPWKPVTAFGGLSLASDPAGNIWIGGEDENVRCFSPSSGTIRTWHVPTRSYFAIWSVCPVSNGQIWLGSNKGLWKLDPGSSANPVAYDQLNDFTGLQESTIYHMLETKEGIWLSTDNGLYLLDIEKGVKAHIDETTSGLPINNLLYLHIDADSIFWLASRGGGLIRWDRANNTFSSYTVNEGLSHNIIYAILEDDFGFLWMPSDFGLMRFEKKTGNCRTFLQADGIPHEEFNRCSYFKDRKGNFYFGGLNGFVVFNPKDLLGVKSSDSPVMLSKLEAINEKTGKTKDLTYAAVTGQQIILEPQVSSFLISYSILDYSDANLQRFAYWIDGLNSNWTYVTDNLIRLNGLRGGTYTIHIKVRAPQGAGPIRTSSFP